MIECGLLSGLFVRHFQKPLAGMVICGTGPHLYLELVRSQLLSGFPDPDHFDLLPVRSSTSHTSFTDAACSRQRVLCGDSRRRDPVILLFRHHGPDGSRLLFASAIATCMRGFFASIRSSHEPCWMQDRPSRLSRDIAPIMSWRLMSACPAFVIRPSRS